jgi:hypothetical protein
MVGAKSIELCFALFSVELKIRLELPDKSFDIAMNTTNISILE